MQHNMIKALSGIEELVTPYAADYARHVYHIYAIRVPGRDEIIESARREWASPAAFTIRCPSTCRTRIKVSDTRSARFPIAERAARQLISLPMFPELTSAQIDIVTRAIQEAVTMSVLT